MGEIGAFLALARIASSRRETRSSSKSPDCFAPDPKETERLANRDNHRGRHLSYQRSRNITHPGTSLIKIEGVDSTNAAKYVSQSRALNDGEGSSTNVNAKTASTSARRSPSSTVARRRSAAPRSA